MTTTTQTTKTTAMRALLAMFLASHAGCGDIEAPSPKTRPPTVASIAPTSGSTLGGQLVAIQGVDFHEGTAVLFDGVPATEVSVPSSGVITAFTPPHGEGSVHVTLIDAHGRVATLESAYEYRRSYDQAGRPRVVGAISTSNTGVRVVFSEPVSDGAADIANFSITHANVNSEAGTLVVRSATPSADGVYVDLVTSAQNEVIYQLAASNIRDLDGNLLAPPELLVNPSVVDFAGTPPTAGNGTLVDTDGDGLHDHVEVGGWVVTVWLSNGDLDVSTHTSDPAVADTDADGLDDKAELLAGSNPREPDTDGDGVTDGVEWNEWWSDPTKQDTDEDGLSDGIDLLFETSPILDDTDGDGYLDYEELFELNRNPLVADLPRPRIVVTSYDLAVEVTSSYTDETGTVHSIDSSSSTNVTQATANSIGRSDTRSAESANRFSQSFGTELSFGGKDGFSGKVSASVGFEQSRAEGYSSTVDTQTATSSQQSYDRSVSEALATSEGRSVTREVASARVVATVNVANESDVPFTLENLEISMLRQGRELDGSFRPVASLRPAGNDELSLNLGPLDSERGPIVFENSDVFPNMVDELMANPAGVIFEVANFDVVDEQGRNFAYTSATVNSRTAGITIDYGDGRIDAYRVATHNRFDASGRPIGITITRGLEILGFDLVQDDAELPSPVPSPLPPAIARSIGTLEDANGVERLVRVGGSQNAFAAATPEKRFWTIQTNDTTLGADSDVSTIVLEPGREYLLMFARDLDRDGLFDREESMYGSSDTDENTDEDTIPDFDEVRVGWSVHPSPGLAYRVFSSPGRADSDLDGLLDHEEREAGTDPNRSDTDGDGLSDAMEVKGGAAGVLEVRVTQGDADETNDVVYLLEPWDDRVGNELRQRIAAGPNGICETVVTGPDEVLVLPGSSSSRGCLRSTDGTLHSTPGGDDFVRPIHDLTYITNPLVRDTDFDGLPDGRELYVGTNPIFVDSGDVVDTDGDGLYDGQETAGWLVPGGATVTSNPNAPDTDLDGIPDVFEHAVGSNPRRYDSDGDGLSDRREFDPVNADARYPEARFWNALQRCDLASRCTTPAAVPLADRLHTSLTAADTDGDTLDDYEEVFVPWTVVVRRGGIETASQVFGRPDVADVDFDGLDDAEEKSLRTNPNQRDTDDDGSGDGYENSYSYAFGTETLRRSPTVVDRIVVMTTPAEIFVEANCNGNWAPAGGRSETTVGQPVLFQGGEVHLFGPMGAADPSGFSMLSAYTAACVGGGWTTGERCVIPTPPTYATLLREGETFSYSIASIEQIGETDPEIANGIPTVSWDYASVAPYANFTRDYVMRDERVYEWRNFCVLHYLFRFEVH